MQDHEPRTVKEFAAHHRQVWVGCVPCNRRKLVANDVLEAMYGAEFDLYAGLSALEAELRCEICGEKHRKIIFHDAAEVPKSVDVRPSRAARRAGG